MDPEEPEELDEPAADEPDEAVDDVPDPFEPSPEPPPSEEPDEEDPDDEDPDDEDPDESPEDDPDSEEVEEGVEDARLSVLKKPLPLNVTPTGWNTFFTAIISPERGCGASVSVSSVNACWTSIVSPVSTNL